MHLSRKGAFAAGVVTTLVIGSGTAVAANGGSLLIGRSNSGTATTTLTNTKGTALSLKAKAGTPPLAVNSNVRVPNLNADRVDGIDSASLALAAGRTGIIWGSERDADGFYNTAVCPAGSVATGGGGYTIDTDDWLGYTGPDFNGSTGNLVPNSWVVYSDGPIGAGAVAFVTCYSSRGAVKGAAGKLPYFPAAQAPAGEAVRRAGAAAQQPRP